MSSTEKSLTIQELLNLNIIDLFGLQNASEEEKKRFLDYATGLVLERVVAQVVKELPEEKREEFFSVFKEDTSEEQKVAFLKEHVPELEELFFEEILIFKNEAVKLASELTDNKQPTTNN